MAYPAIVHHIFGILTYILFPISMVPGIFGASLDQYLVVINQMLLQCLCDQTSQPVSI